MADVTWSWHMSTDAQLWEANRHFKTITRNIERRLEFLGDTKSSH
jgi:hypothetical protein